MEQMRQHGWQSSWTTAYAASALSIERATGEGGGGGIGTDGLCGAYARQARHMAEHRSREQGRMRSPRAADPSQGD